MSEPVSEQLHEGEKGDSLARTGAKYIYNATIRFPGLAAAEGVEIARLCQKFQKDPEQLKSALLEDESQIEWLIEEGNKHHPKNNIDRVVMRPRMVDMIVGIFSYAKGAMGNTPEELAHALEQYPKYAMVEGRFDEPKYGDEVMVPLADARRQRAEMAK